MNLLHLLQQKFDQALTSLVPDPAPYVAMVKPVQDPRFGDYQANCAMALAKALGRKPRDLAQELVQRLPLDDLLEPPEIAGPGFINLRLRPDWLARQIQQMAADERLGVEKMSPARTIVLDYSSPNVAKPLHVGHLRSTIIGDALARLLRFLGHAVITDNHLGDWGTQMGMLIYGYKQFRDDRALQNDPVREMVRLYVKVRELTKPADDEDKEEDNQGAKYTAAQVAEAQRILAICREETVKLHTGNPENVALWRQFMPWCLEDIESIYARLGVKFDHTLGESSYNPMLPDVVTSLQARGIAQPSKGALAIFFAEGETPALVQKQDGAFTYTTTDLATIRYRMETWKPDAVLYVVDFRQSLHFQHLFEAARRWGHDRVDLQHISFGSVLGPDRKPIKTREGGAVELRTLLDEAVDRGTAVYEVTRAQRRARGEEVPELGEAERRDIAHVVGLGAVKYADLSQNRTTDYVFGWDKMLAMDGNTATYMQYAYARIRSIFRKGDEDEAALRAAPPLPILEEVQERALARALLGLQEALEAGAAEYKPNLLTSYLWDLAKSYSAFYGQCHVLNAATPELRRSRLLLCDVTARTIRLCLSLLGIGTVERM